MLHLWSVVRVWRGVWGYVPVWGGACNWPTAGRSCQLSHFFHVALARRGRGGTSRVARMCATCAEHRHTSASTMHCSFFFSCNIYILYRSVMSALSSSESDRHHSTARRGQARHLRPAIRSSVVDLCRAEILVLVLVLILAADPAEDEELATHHGRGVSPPYPPKT